MQQLLSTRRVSQLPFKKGGIMAIVTGLRVCGALWCAHYLHKAISQGICPRSADKVEVTDSVFRTFVNQQARSMGIHKPVLLFRAPDCECYGNNLLPGEAGVSIDQENFFEARIILVGQLALIRDNGYLVQTIVPVIVAIATFILLNPVYPIFACLAGIGIGNRTVSILAGIYEEQIHTAMRQYM